jgi:hypothetical protein
MLNSGEVDSFVAHNLGEDVVTQEGSGNVTAPAMYTGLSLCPTLSWRLAARQDPPRQFAELLEGATTKQSGPPPPELLRISSTPIQWPPQLHPR